MGHIQEKVLTHVSNRPPQTTSSMYMVIMASFLKPKRVQLCFLKGNAEKKSPKKVSSENKNKISEKQVRYRFGPTCRYVLPFRLKVFIIADYRLNSISISYADLNLCQDLLETKS